jgi:hypothetical protein
MVLLYVINIYWCYTKINSIVKTVARLLGLGKGAAGEGGGRTAAPAFKKSAPCYHGGRSWDASGLDILGKRSEIVVADVLDAPFAPSPKCAKAVMDTLGADSRSACLRESPPTNCEVGERTSERAQRKVEERVRACTGSKIHLLCVLSSPPSLSP